MHGTWISDPYQWLEDDESPEVASWAAERDKEARHVVSTADTKRLENRLTELLDRDKRGAPQRFGERNFFWRFGPHDSKAIFSYEEKGTEVDWLDTNGLSGTVSEVVPSWDGLKAIYKYHPEQNDLAHLVVLDLGGTAPYRVLADLPGARFAHPSWTPGNDGFFYTYLPPKPDDLPEADHSGLQTIVHYSLTNETRVVVPPTNDPKQSVSVKCTRNGRFLIRSRSDGWDQTAVDILRLDAAYAANGSWEALSRGSGVFQALHHDGTFFLFQVGGGAPRGRVLAVKDTVLSVQEELVSEGRDVLRTVDFLGGHLVLGYLQDLRPVVEIRALDGQLKRTFGLPSGAASALVQDRSCALLPVEDGRGLGVIYDFAGDPEQAKAFFFVEAPLHPPAILSLDLPGGAFELWHQQNIAAPQKAAEIRVSQVFADNNGVRIPAILMQPATDGPKRTILYGYGGFDLILYPAFRPDALAWVELGNTFVVANLRGGGEYGQAWHEAGMNLRKQNVFDDFAAVARHLIAEKVTTSSQLMARGRSNGGLLVGAAITQHPELFSAAAIAVPLLDMVRYTEFDSGAQWIPEYGDPQNETEFANLLAYSPYHHVSAKEAYPAVLLESTTSDDRVSPMHARKFFARLAAAGHDDVWLRVRSGGHGCIATREERARAMAESMGFGLQHLAVNAESATGSPSLGLVLFSCLLLWQL
jgi:prolyl oligopeptidase